MRRALQLLLVVVVAALIAAPVASAQHTVPAGSAVLTDCNLHGTLTKQYTSAQLHQALSVMPTWMKQYTSCEQVIQKALSENTAGLKKTGTGSGGGSGGVSTGLIVVIVIVVVAIVAFGWLLVRRRRTLTREGGLGDAPTEVTEPPTRAFDDGPDDRSEDP